eukprot:2616452-Prymnesium_polylepis.1
MGDKGGFRAGAAREGDRLATSGHHGDNQGAGISRRTHAELRPVRVPQGGALLAKAVYAQC